MDQMQKPRQNCGLNTFYGYGLRIATEDEYTVIGHGGSMVGISSDMSWSHEIGAAVIVLCNTMGVTVSAVGDAAGQMLWDKESAAEWTSEQLEDVCGHYVCDEGSEAHIELRGKQLFVSMGGAELEITPINRTTLRAHRAFGKMDIGVLRDGSQKTYAVSAG